MTKLHCLVRECPDGGMTIDSGPHNVYSAGEEEIIHATTLSATDFVGNFLANLFLKSFSQNVCSVFDQQIGKKKPGSSLIKSNCLPNGSGFAMVVTAATSSPRTAAESEGRATTIAAVRSRVISIEVLQ